MRAPASQGRPQPSTVALGGGPVNRGVVVRLTVKVAPSSPRDALAGWLGNTLKVRVRAPAERGQANAAVERLVAAALGIPADNVRVVAGRTSRLKTLDITGMTPAEVRLPLVELTRADKN